MRDQNRTFTIDRLDRWGQTTTTVARDLTRAQLDEQLEDMFIRDPHALDHIKVEDDLGREIEV